MKAQKYKMRAECQHDLGRFLQNVQVSNFTAVQHDGIPDMTVDFISKMSLVEIRKTLADIVDGHVMAETVELASKYTGNR